MAWESAIFSFNGEWYLETQVWFLFTVVGISSQEKKYMPLAHLKIKCIVQTIPGPVLGQVQSA